MTLRLPIPAVALLGLQLGACSKDDPIVGQWEATVLDGDPIPDSIEMILDIDADLGGDLDYNISYAGYADYSSEYHSTLKVDASEAPIYVIDILPTEDIEATQLRCELAGDTLKCSDVLGNGFGDTTFKRG